MAKETGTEGRRGRVRWWPAVVIVVLAGLLLVGVWVREGSQRQGRILATLVIAAVAALLLIVWLALLSRMRWKARLAALASIGALAIAGALSVEVRDVSGDVLPLLDWRWSPAPGEVTAAMARPEAARPARPAPAPALFDYPQFLGPRRDGTIRGVRLARDWSISSPRQLWRQRIGAGWSGFAVVGDLAVTHEQRDAQEVVTCYELRSGRLRWAHAYDARFDNPLGGVGPRATPAIDGGRVFALGATGILSAIDLATGEAVWTRDIVEDNGAAVPTYGVSASPLAFDGKVVVAAGGAAGRSLVAYDQRDGERVWSGGDARAAYSSPMRVEVAGDVQIVILNDEALTAHDADSGALLWQARWPGETQKASQPVVLPGDRVFVSTGYGVGGKLFRIRQDDDGDFDAELVWESRGLKAKFANVVFHGGRLYGLDDGILACLESETGDRCWKGGRYGHGQVLLVEDLILVLEENGSVALVEARPDSYSELSRVSVLDGKTWNHPALSERFLLVRNDREAACFELPLE